MPLPLVRAVQRFYPQIYLACHADHVRAKSNRYHVSAHDSGLLAHLEDEVPVSPARLAKHLGVAASTLSASLKRLESLGYVARRAHPGDKRRVELTITAAGSEAMDQSSVLETGRVASVLEHLSVADRKRAVAGLGLLAGAARTFQMQASRRKRW